jgi:hypothetical protein
LTSRNTSWNFDFKLLSSLTRHVSAGDSLPNDRPRRAEMTIDLYLDAIYLPILNILGKDENYK